MLCRLRAAEQIDRINAVAIGTGSMKTEDRARILRQLQRDLAGGQRPKMTMRQQKVALAAIGIKVVPVDKEP